MSETINPFRGTGYMPEDWKPRLRFIYSTIHAHGSKPERRKVLLRVGGKHVSLPDGTRIEPMQIEIPLDDLEELGHALNKAKAWLAELEPEEHEYADEVN